MQTSGKEVCFIPMWGEFQYNKRKPTFSERLQTEPEEDNQDIEDLIIKWVYEDLDDTTNLWNKD